MSQQFSFSSRVSVTPQQRQEFLQFAEKCVFESGPLALPFFRTQLKVDNKLENGGFDPVTEADRAVEMSIREQISSTFPSHGICGEEFGFESGNGLTWVIDPIDGTRAFMSGMLHWGVLLALFDGEEPIVGAMYQPYVDELFIGDGEQSWVVHAGSRSLLRASSKSVVSDAVLATTGTDWFPKDELAQFQAISEVAKLTRVGGDCYVHAMVATGGVDLAIDATLNPYDIQALVPIVRGAGGVVTCIDGGSAAMGGTVLTSANAEIHAAALTLIQEA